MPFERLWRCPKCARRFANRNQSHSCAPATPLAQHFTRKDPVVRAIYDEFVTELKRIGRFRVLSEKTRIAFQVRMSFAQVTPRRRWLDGHIVLARRIDHPRFLHVQTFSPRNHLHAFRLTSVSDIDDLLLAWLREAYDVGAQRHLLHRARP